MLGSILGPPFLETPKSNCNSDHDEHQDPAEVYSAACWRSEEYRFCAFKVWLREESEQGVRAFRSCEAM